MAMRLDESEELAGLRAALQSFESLLRALGSTPREFAAQRAAFELDPGGWTIKKIRGLGWVRGKEALAAVEEAREEGRHEGRRVALGMVP